VDLADDTATLPRKRTLRQRSIGFVQSGLVHWKTRPAGDLRCEDRNPPV